MNERRDIEMRLASTPGFPSPGRNLITVVGIDRYVAWQRLTNAVSDARGAASAFGRLGFEQIAEPLFDSRATGKAIQELVTDDLAAVGTDDSLVVFYAGHGGTRTHQVGDQVVKTGYLIPVDASDKVASWIELDSWLRAISLLPVRHVLVILDACHSGLALGPIIKWRDAGTSQETPLSTLAARRSRRIITSALDDQVALDCGPLRGHSLFTGCLIEGLTHGLGRGKNQPATGSELGLYLQHRVKTYPNSKQTPDFGAFDFDDRGEMVIRLIAGEPVAHDADRITEVNEFASTSISQWPDKHGSDTLLIQYAGAKIGTTLGRFRGRRRLNFVAAGVLISAILVTIIAMSGGEPDGSRINEQRSTQPDSPRTPSDPRFDAPPSGVQPTAMALPDASDTTDGSGSDTEVAVPPLSRPLPKTSRPGQKSGVSSGGPTGAVTKPGSAATGSEGLSNKLRALTEDDRLDMRH